MAEQNRGKEDRHGGAPPSPLKSTTPTPTGTPNATRAASSRPSEDQFSDADAAAAKALGVVPPVSEPGGAAGAAAAMEEENAAAAADGADPEDAELDLASGDEGKADALIVKPTPSSMIPDSKCLGFVEFYFEDLKDSSKIPHWRATGAFHDAAVEIDDIPILPTDGSGCNPVRTMFQFYMDHPFCVAFCAATPQVLVLDDDGVQKTMLTRVRKCLPEAPNRFENKVPNSFLEEEAVYLEIDLTKGYQFASVHKNMITKRLEEWGLTVYRGARMQVKMPKNVNDPEEGFLNMGAELRTNNYQTAGGVGAHSLPRSEDASQDA